jgi:hypothetical protein
VTLLSPKRIFFQFSNTKEAQTDTNLKTAENNLSKPSGLKRDNEAIKGTAIQNQAPINEKDNEKESYLQEYLQKIGNIQRSNPPNQSINQTVLQTAIKKTSESVVENSSIHPKDRNSLSNFSGSRFFKSESRDYEMSQERQDRSLLNTGVSQGKRHLKKESYGEDTDKYTENSIQVAGGLFNRNREAFIILKINTL